MTDPLMVTEKIKDAEIVSRSPVPGKKAIATMSFPDAIKEMLEGKRISKLEWDTNDVYCEMYNGEPMLYKNGTYYPWIINSGDVNGEDWFIMPK